LELDIDVHFNAQVCEFKKHGYDGRILSVDVASAEPQEDEVAETIKCQNIIVAAGPWTSGIVSDLLPWANFSVDNHLKRYEQIHIPNMNLAAEDDCGVVFGDGDMTSKAHAEDEDILAAIIIDKGENKHLPIDLAIKGTSSHDTKSVEYAAKKHLRSYSKAGMTRACSWVCTATEGGLPIIDKIPAAKVDERFGGEEESPLGIWLCYGFGTFGTTLAPGAARALRRRICGEKSGIGEAVCSAFE